MSEKPAKQPKQPKQEQPSGFKTEGKFSAHDHYLVKKETAKLVMADKGIPFQEAFDSIPDDAIISRNPKEVFNALKK